MPTCKNQKGQVLQFDENGYSQYGYDKDGYDEYVDFDPQQVATCSNDPVPVSGTSGSQSLNNGDTLLGGIFGVLNTAGQVWTSSNQAHAAQANAQAAQANAATVYGSNLGRPATSGKTLLFVGIGVVLIAGIIIAVVASKKSAPAAPAAPAA